MSNFATEATPPDATGKCGELVTVGGINLASGELISCRDFDDDNPLHIPCCRKDRAAELLATITKERDHWKEYSSGQGKLIESGVFVTNDEYVRLTSLEAKLAAAEKVLEPFAEYCGDHFDKDFNGNPLPDEQKVGWVYLNYGHFRRARAALGGKPS
ncbi:hypothetical protein F9K96_06885 [Brucella anthropi]|uniref:hypothetical protein n=1 Tax=Brucella anthropi TaxID=529 RepID=UPI00124F1625|nr:hypothetical protein [Brucella anthropi]KAB2792846.1 hypothetical protein F9K96_06885 [Brucella anthropi]